MRDIRWLQLTHCNCVFILNLSPFGIEPHSFGTTITTEQNYCYMYSSPHIYTFIISLSIHAVISQFSGPYRRVWPAKI